jgi:thiol-disulfide isomerase/thioredoxin
MLAIIFVCDFDVCEAKGVVVEITDQNYDQLVREGPWMMVVTASWCPHCKQLEPTWSKLAEKLEAKGTKVGQIDGPEQRILARRLQITGFPHIFHVDKHGKIREYGERSRQLEKLVDFAVSEYLQTEPLPWYHTPHSHFGQIVKALLELPKDLENLYRFLSSEMGLSDVFIIFSSLVIPLLVSAVFIGVIDIVMTKLPIISQPLAGA